MPIYNKEKLGTTNIIRLLIINRNELTRFEGNRASRLVLDALEVAVDSVMPSVLVSRAVKFNKTLLVRDIHRRVIKLPKFDRVYVVGAGKATGGMAEALRSILQDKIADGAITVPYAINRNIKGISVTKASHPLPDMSGVKGTRKILNVLKKARQNDLVFVLISGGGSALMPLPTLGVSLAEKQLITNQLLRSGASIHELNAVRKHLSAVKGGQLLRHIDSSCIVVSLILSDVVGDDFGVIASGPTCPDYSSFADALQIIEKYDIKNSRATVEYIVKGVKGEIEETPKPNDPIFSKVHNILIGNNSIACTNATSYLKKHGVRAINMGSGFEGEARDFGAYLARITTNLGSKPFAIVAGGETTVKLNKSKNGVGGRNQEAALACVVKLRRHDVAVAFMGTDGIDGNSDAAGALVSPKSISLVTRIHLKQYLNNHDSYHAFKKLNSLIFTGQTGTNVNDIAIICKA